MRPVDIDPTRDRRTDTLHGGVDQDTRPELQRTEILVNHRLGIDQHSPIAEVPLAEVIVAVWSGRQYTPKLYRSVSGKRGPNR